MTVSSAGPSGMGPSAGVAPAPRAESRGNDGDGDDKKAAAAPAGGASVNLQGQVTGQHVNAVA